MDRTLVILRHAKAEQGDGLHDIERALSERGRADAAAAGTWLISHGYWPDLVLCSPARRTRQTWRAVLAAGTSAPVVRYEAPLYSSGTAEILELVRTVTAEYHMTMVVGHNPSVSQLSALLDPETARDPDGLRTSGIAVHAWDGEWADCHPDGGRLTASHTARA